MIVLYTILSLAILGIMGYATMKLLGCGQCAMLVDNVALYIVFGCITTTSIIMILGLILPISVVTIAVCIFLVVFSIGNYKEILNIIATSCGTEEKVLFGVSTVPMILVGLPQILRSELYISILSNNDFGYYIASIDWLKNHSILQKVEYSSRHPFYSMAEYMLDYTRIGMDTLGAFLANIFGLESYEIFPVIGTIAVVLLFLVAYEFIYRFTSNYILSLVFSLFASLNGNIVTLIGKQYVPQLLGMTMLILTVYMINRFFEETDRNTIVLCGIAISGLLEFYCEYAVYLVVIIIAYMLTAAIKKKRIMIPIIKVCILSGLFNPYGMYKALKFNLSIFSRVSTRGAQDIDPYGGNMLGIKKILGCLLGFSDCLSEKNLYYTIAFASGTAILLICLAILVISIKRENMRIIIIPVFAFSLLQAYFVYSHGAYQEYKHITSVSTMGITLMGCMVGWMLQRCKKEKIVQYVVLGMILLINVCGIYNPLKTYCKNRITLDSDTMQLRENVEQNIPISSEIEIDSSMGVANYMAATYALKDYNVNLNTDSLSYLQYFQTFEDNDPSMYALYEKEFFADDDNEIIWANEKYVLKKRKNIQDYTIMEVANNGFSSGAGVFVSAIADYVENVDGHEGFVLYGPYADINNGTYEFVLEYSVTKNSGKSGYFDIFIEGEEKYYQDLENDLGRHKLTIPLQTFKDEENVEFRVFANEGTVLKVEGLKYRRVTGET